MTARFDGDVRVTGNLTVDGSTPPVERADIAQDALVAFAIPLTDWRIHDDINSHLPGTAAADDLELDGGTFGTDAPTLQTDDVAASTVTRYARCLVRLPAEYDAGNSVALRLSAGMITTAADTSATVDVEVYKHDRETGVGSDLCATAAQSINATTFADKDFTITDSGITAGDILDIRVAIAVTDSATGTAVIGAIAAAELLCDIRA